MIRIPPGFPLQGLHVRAGEDIAAAWHAGRCRRVESAVIGEDHDGVGSARMPSCSSAGTTTDDAQETANYCPWVVPTRVIFRLTTLASTGRYIRALASDPARPRAVWVDPAGGAVAGPCARHLHHLHITTGAHGGGAGPFHIGGHLVPRFCAPPVASLRCRGSSGTLEPRPLRHDREYRRQEVAPSPTQSLVIPVDPARSGQAGCPRRHDSG